MRGRICGLYQVLRYFKGELVGPIRYDNFIFRGRKLQSIADLGRERQRERIHNPPSSVFGISRQYSAYLIELISTLENYRDCNPTQPDTMKRKIDDLREDAPPIALPQADAKSPQDAAFTDFGLDSRILTAIAGQSFHKPTTPQALAIPQILDGRSLVLRAKTGSGKTLCYLLPLIESILRGKGAEQQSTSALVLVPTRELADQVLRTIETFIAFCQKDVRAIKLSEQLPDEVVRSMLASTPHIVVATPSRACASLKISSSWVSSLKMLVIDESDLVLSYGYEEDLTTLAASIPKGVQAVLTSATLTSDVDRLKNRFCKNPAVLDLNEPEAEGEGIKQYVVECGEDDKFLLIYVLLKLKLIRGKCLIFVADDVDRSYRLKLYLEQFGIRSA